MSPTYISSALIVVVQVLQFFGIAVASEDLSTTVNTLITIGAGLVILYRRYAKGDIQVSGLKK